MSNKRIPFNQSQRLGLDIDRHIALDAGAGTGKTTVMAERYVQHLLSPVQRSTLVLPHGPREPLSGHGSLRAPARERTDRKEWKGLLPSEVVAITFTKKAASELKARIRARVAQTRRSPVAPDDEVGIFDPRVGPKTTAIIGGSNGGLLVAATMLQNPDLFEIAIPQVGVLDMLRFHKFTIGWAWESDYGSPDNKEEFENLLAYSPYHNVLENRCYPKTLVTTASRDDRVVPSHSFKFAARLQELQGCDNPVLIRVESRAGHGAGTPKSKVIDQISEIYGYALSEIKG